MKTELQTGKYVVAVSGGVDSVTLLDLLAMQKNLQLIVAHFDHGIRSDSKQDKQFVEKLAKKYNLPFEYAEGQLGKNASEEVARQARYKFLEQIQKKYSAKAIVTAHHQDDVLETICLNILRGTNRKGLSSLGDTNNIKRPLLTYSKKQIIDYAQKNNLMWREDSTNQDDKYLRNWVRNNIISRLDKKQRQQLLDVHQTARQTNQELDELLNVLVANSPKLERRLIINSDYKTSLELVAHWLRKNDLRSFEQKTLERIVIGAKTLKPGKIIPIYGLVHVEVTKTDLVINKTAV